MLVRAALLAVVALFALAACDSRDATHSPAYGGIVSLDLCADQFVLALADPSDIRALSAEADAPGSALRQAADRFGVVRPRAEAVLALRPRTVIRAYGGGPDAAAFYDRLGIDVIQIGWAADLDAVRTITSEVATALDVGERGAALVTAMDRRLEAARHRAEGAARGVILYVTPGGVTTGPGSLIHEAMKAAGGENYETRPGWHDLPLERLATTSPDLVAFGFYDTQSADHYRWSAARHPILDRAAEGLGTVGLSATSLVCGAPSIADATEALATATSKAASAKGAAP